jgi:hypothetical protein
MAKKKKKTKSSTKPAAKHVDQAPAEDQKAPVGIRAEGMPKFDLSSPTADEIQAAAAQVNDGGGHQSLAARGLELLKEGSMEDPQVKSLFGMSSQMPTAHELYEDQVTELSGGSSTESSTESLERSAERAKKAVLETYDKLRAQEAPAPPALQEKIQVPTKLEICSCEWGYGVFASAKIDDGEIIEEAPFITLPIRTGDAKENEKAAALLPHVSPIACGCQECRDLGVRIVISSGYIQMYNHSDAPNARLLQHKANKRIYVIETMRSVEPGEQIFINYGPGYPREWLMQPHMQSTDAKNS